MSDTIIIAIGTADIDDTSKTAENVTGIVENAKTKGYTNIIIVPPNPDPEIGFPDLHNLVKNAATSAGATAYPVDGLYHGKEQPELLTKENAAEIKNAYPGAVIVGDSNAARINSFNASSTIKKEGTTTDILDITTSENLGEAIEEDPVSLDAFVLDSIDRALLDHIAEGESGRLGYFAHYSNSSNPSLTTKTLRQVQMFQARLLKNNGGTSCAVGRYQFIKAPLAETIRSLKLDIDLTRYSPEIQDVICIKRLYSLRQYKKWKLGKITDIDFMINLCKEFASIPLPVPVNGKAKGESYYSGVLDNSAHGKPDEFLQGLKDCKKGGNGKTTRVDATTNSNNTANPSVGVSDKRATEHAVSAGQVTSGGKRVNSYPSTPSELPAVSDVYKYELIDPQDDRYDFRLGKKIRDVAHLGEKAIKDMPDYAPPGDNSGVVDDSLDPFGGAGPTIPNPLEAFGGAGPTVLDSLGDAINIDPLEKLENVKQIKDQLGKVGISDISAVSNIAGMCENVSGLATDYVKSYANIANSSIRNIFGNAVSNFSDAQLGDLKSSPTKFFDEILKNDGGSKFSPAGFLGIAGKANFQAIADSTGLDIVNNVNLLKDPITSARTAAEFFKNKASKVDLSSARNVFVQATGVDPFLETDPNKRYEFMNQFRDVENKSSVWKNILTPSLTANASPVIAAQSDSLEGISDKPLPQTRTSGTASQRSSISREEKELENITDRQELLDIVNNSHTARDGRIYDQDNVDVGEAPEDSKIKVDYQGEVEYDDPRKRFANDGTGRVEDVIEKLTAPTRFFRNTDAAVRQIDRYKLDITQFAIVETPNGRAQVRLLQY